LTSQPAGVNVVLQHVEGYGGGLQDFKEAAAGDGRRTPSDSSNRSSPAPSSEALLRYRHAREKH
jgi:hypothetical protein